MQRCTPREDGKFLSGPDDTARSRWSLNLRYDFERALRECSLYHRRQRSRKYDQLQRHVSTTTGDFNRTRFRFTWVNCRHDGKESSSRAVRDRIPMGSAEDQRGQSGRPCSTSPRLPDFADMSSTLSKAFFLSNKDMRRKSWFDRRNLRKS